MPSNFFQKISILKELFQKSNQKKMKLLKHVYWGFHLFIYMSPKLKQFIIQFEYVREKDPMGFRLFVILWTCEQSLPQQYLSMSTTHLEEVWRTWTFQMLIFHTPWRTHEVLHIMYTHIWFNPKSFIFSKTNLANFGQTTRNFIFLNF